MGSTICALYVHVPMCRSRCAYCDFYSEVVRPGVVAALVSAILAELERASRTRTLSFRTLFVGGGTPTALPTHALERLLRGCAGRLGGLGPEFTVEANPATVDAATADMLVRAGVNRLSLGAQSFLPAELAVLERAHAPAAIAETVETCRVAGLRHFSLDLIFGIPGQTLATWRQSLAAAISLEPEHLSCYGLTYEPGTRLHTRLTRGEVKQVDPDLEADMYELAIDTLAAAGYQQYEISNFARPGAECRHNLTYWRNEPYLGIGPAAAGYVDGLRYKNVADTDAYICAINAGETPYCEQEHLDPAQCARETAMLALRTTTGLDCRRFSERFGLDPLHFFATAIDKHAGNGLLEADAGRIRLTRRGLLLADRVIADFL
jgi:oxygen-independent coproporphyrinogen-3 oxidase